MKFKQTQKKEMPRKALPKKKPSLEKKTDSLRKEEIREVVEETIEALSEDPLSGEEKTGPAQVKEESAKAPESTDSPKEPSEMVQTSPEASNEPSESEKSENTTPSPEEKKENTATTALPSVSVDTEGVNVNTQEVSSASVPVAPQVDSTAAPSPMSPVTASVSVGSEGSSQQNQQTSIKKLLLLAFFAFIFGLILLSAFWYLTSNNMFSLQKYIHLPGIQPVPTRSMQPTAAPTSAKQVDLSKYSITVLNGSGLAGEASKAKDMLTTAGFTVGSIGNASSSDETTTTISAKSDVSKDYLDKLVEALQARYTVSATVASAGASQTSEVVVTLGSGLK